MSVVVGSLEWWLGEAGGGGGVFHRWLEVEE